MWGKVYAFSTTRLKIKRKKNERREREKKSKEDCWCHRPWAVTNRLSVTLDLAADKESGGRCGNPLSIFMSFLDNSFSSELFADTLVWFEFITKG